MVSYRLSKPIIFVGLMGSGKSAIGQLVADILGVPFLDSDREIEKAASMTISEIFERDGETFFRAREQEVIQRLLSNDPLILATGGGAFMNEKVREATQRLGVTVWLKADLELLWSRVKNKPGRPLIAGEDGYQRLSDLLDTRSPIYALADVTVEGEADLSKDEMARKVVNALVAAKQSGVMIDE